MKLRQSIGLLTSALLFTLSAAARADPTKDEVPRIASFHLTGSPLLFALVQGNEYDQPHDPIMLGARAELLYQYGFFRVGGAISYINVISLNNNGVKSCIQAFSPMPVVSFAYTFRNGAELGLTLGVGPYVGWRRSARIDDADPYLPDWRPELGLRTDLLGIFATPIAKNLDLSFAMGASGHTPWEWDYLAFVLEAGIRKHF